MVKVLVGNLFESRAQTVVNTVNTVGVMGKGIALEFKRRYPDMYDDYVERCRRGEVRLGIPYLFKTSRGRWVLNFPTKGHWRSVSRLDDIVRGLEYLLVHYEEWGIQSIAVPPLGCGNGQLEWSIVGPTLYRYLQRMNVPVELYAPYGTPREELQVEYLRGVQTIFPVFQPAQPKVRSKSEWIQPGWLAILEVVHRIRREPYSWPVGRTLFQKIAYALTYLGVPTGLTYKRGSYGPYSSELKQVASRLVNNGLMRETKSGRMFVVDIGPTYHDAVRAYSEQLRKWKSAVGKTVDLFLRTTTLQAEIVATVLYAYGELNIGGQKPTELNVLEAVMEWKRRRQPPFEREAVALAIRSLAGLGWIDVRGCKDLPLPRDQFFGV